MVGQVILFGLWAFATISTYSLMLTYDPDDRWETNLFSAYATLYLTINGYLFYTLITH